MSMSEIAEETVSTDVSETERLRGELAVLREENERLRAEYVRARQSQYRQSATTLVLVGVLVLAAGAVVASARTVLVALGGTGVFLGVLIYFLTPEQFISASVGEAVYASLARNESQAVTELGLTDERVYVPRGAGESGGVSDVRLFVPQHPEYEVPAEAALDDRFVVVDDPKGRGMALRPSAADLYADLEDAVSGEPSEEVGELARELSDALVEEFELVESAWAETVGESRVAVRVSGSAMGGVDRFDHPVASLLGVSVARAVEEATAAETVEDGDEFVVTCSWMVDETD
ncbi:hypothetical protein HZS55_05880 [Halosimplex rubrum]|uniref:DUF7982 domain-containing protein n=1 Tax=Halosimplex rubrum TaxID=869889 RepID=A0A7D5P1Q8_9EURY|nr:hypothetical protein [Halosimplex rubrum]QLH76861.1 hypothetical protein HZS55_05880 [Halosimplex rubrum]